MSLNLATVFKPPATISLTITARPLRRWIEPSSGWRLDRALVIAHHRI